MPENDYVPLISNIHFRGVAPAAAQSFGACRSANRSRCYNLTVDGAAHGGWDEPLPPQVYGCKTRAKTLFGEVAFPWGACIPLDAPVNLRPRYPNWGETVGRFTSLEACKAACVVR